MNATATRTVAAPIDRVWQVLADHEGMTGWAPGLRASLDQPGDGERNGVGAVRRIKAPGPAPAIVEEITGYEPGRRLGYRALSGVPFKDYSGEVSLAEHGSGTKITWTLSATARVAVVEKTLLAATVRGLLFGLVRAIGR